MNLNTLSPWETEFDFEKQETQQKQEESRKKQQKRISVSLTPSKIPISQAFHIRTPTMVQTQNKVKDPLHSIKRKRLSLVDCPRRRKSEEQSDRVQIIQNQYPIEPKTMTDCSPIDQINVRTKSLRQEVQYIQTQTQEDRKLVRFQMIPELKIKINQKRKSTSQLHLRNTHFFDQHKTKKLQPSKKFQNVIQDLIKKHPLRTEARGSKTKFCDIIQPCQTIRTMNFDSEHQYRKNPVKAYSKLRVDHFLDKLLQRMC